MDKMHGNVMQNEILIIRSSNNDEILYDFELRTDCS